MEELSTAEFAARKVAAAHLLGDVVEQKHSGLRSTLHSMEQLLYHHPGKMVWSWILRPEGTVD
jgi:hypothetical protein